MRPCGSLVTALVLAGAIVAPRAALADDEEAEEEEDEEEDEEEEEEEDTGPAKPQAKQGGSTTGDFVKQDLSGHDLGTNKKANEFEKNRFFVDKVDTKKTEKGTLIQGSLASSSFAYAETGGNYPNQPGVTTGPGSNAAAYNRLFTELRLQTDFRHISGSRWEARVDARSRFVNSGGNTGLSADPNRIQSGYNGTNEYEIRELWAIRSGKRSDIIIGRQFITDLAAVKIDGLRIDYAQSEKLTLLGFGGLYPVRGSRSLTTDYIPLRDQAGNKQGSIVAAAGFGGAYRTSSMYGSLGGVALLPVGAGGPRVFATSNGYYRAGPQLDIYHYGLLDVIGAQDGNNASGVRLTNASLGANYKPSQRLRLTASFNRTDTDTLNAQARGFLDGGDVASTSVINESAIYITRLSTNHARAGVSAALGAVQRFELSTSVGYRYRPDITLTAPDGVSTATLKAAQGVDVFASFIDRRSIKDARIGFDISRTFGIGAIPYQRTELLAARLFVGRAIADGRGEWEAEVNYATTKDVNAGTNCMVGTLDTCFGSTTNTIISAGGTAFYRINNDWMVLGTVNVARQATNVLIMNVPSVDPGIIGFTGYVRIAYRF